LDAFGNSNIKKNSGVVLDHKGNVFGEIIQKGFSKAEILRELVKARKQQRKLNFLPRKLRDAGEVFFKISVMPPGSEAQAMRLITENPFFREGLILGHLTFAKPAGMLQIKEACEDYFLKAASLESKGRKKSLRENARTLVKGSRDITLK
jgi:hypothetical protein